MATQNLNHNTFLGDFVQELNMLLNNSLTINDKIYKVGVHSFILDSQAKAFVKCVKTHSGYDACYKCTVYGQ